MKPRHRLVLYASLGLAAQALHVRAEDPPAEEEKRVQYQLVLPDEKTPENVKPEEHNPFESETEAQNRLSPGDTEENRVRDRLLKLPVVGTKRMADGGMRVLLGNIILETGKVVPPVIPDQQVELKVKNITTEYIELAWQEKRATGLPPKLMVIPINISPRVRYQMLGQSGEDREGRGGVNATMEMPLRNFNPGPNLANDKPPAPAVPTSTPPAVADEFIRTAPPATQSQEPTAAALEMAQQKSAQPEEAPATAPVTKPQPTTPPSPAVESVVRMLFGNPTPAPK